MAGIDVVKVRCSRELDDFIRVPYQLYKGCDQYVPDMESDIRELFDRKKNPAHRFSKIQPFVAYRNHQPVGRIVGIINEKANAKWRRSTVRFSLIEFIDDLSVSRALLHTVAAWGRSFGMDTIQGPMGITDFDKEGMLLEDYHLMGSMNTVYNLPYYPRHMDELGLEKEVDWVQIRVEIPPTVPERYRRVAQYAREQMRLRVVKLTNGDIKRGYGKKIFDLLNKAYSPIFGFSELSDEQVDHFVNKYMQLIDKRLIPVVLNEHDEVVGVAITMGSLSQTIRKTHGRLLPLGWLHLLNGLKWHREDGVEMLLVAVRPDLQGYGVNALFFDDLIPIYNELGFRWAETGPQLENNMRELSQWKPLNPEYVKRRRCYCGNIQETEL